MDFSELIQVPKLNNVVLHRQLKPPIYGTLCLTFSHIIVSSRNNESENSNENEEIWVSKKIVLYQQISITSYHPAAAPEH